jgi:hypothetical protein
MRKEKEDAHWRNHEAFKEMVQKAREEKRLADEAKKAIEEAQPSQRLSIEAPPAESTEAVVTSSEDT